MVFPAESTLGALKKHVFHKHTGPKALYVLHIILVTLSGQYQYKDITD